MTGFTRGYQVGTVLVAVAGLSFAQGCASVPAPGPDPLESDFKPIKISVNATSKEQRILGELYQIAFKQSKRSSYVSVDPMERPGEDRISRLSAYRADLIVGCTGELLELLDPVGARKLSAEYLASTKGVVTGKEVSEGTWREKTYTAMVNSLPGSMMASDPSSAMGCTDYTGPELPQNVVTVFRKPMLDREDRLILNKVGGTISTGDIEELKEQSSSAAMISAATRNYAQSHGL